MNINNFYLIDKPINITSFDVIRQLRKKLNIKKMWHTWTLDPLASGALLVATWNYTKLIPFLEKDTKEYEFTVNLDGISPSFDLGTDVEYLSDEDQSKYKNSIKIELIEEILKNKFTWEIEQVPPKYSALKIWWKRAFDKARKWEDFDMKKRECTIYNIKLLGYSYPEVKIRAKVSAGTYIRSIAYDLWQILWTWWYVSYLRRTKIWKIDLQYANNLDSEGIKFLDEKILFGLDRFITLDDNNISRINDWLTRKIDLDLDNQDYFLEKEWKITNIINYDKGIITPLKRIL